MQNRKFSIIKENQNGRYYRTDTVVSNGNGSKNNGYLREKNVSEGVNRKRRHEPAKCSLLWD